MPKVEPKRKTRLSAGFFVELLHNNDGWLNNKFHSKLKFQKKYFAIQIFYYLRVVVMLWRLLGIAASHTGAVAPSL